MAFELSNFAVSLPINMLIAEREGLARADAIRVGAIASVLVNPLPMSILVAQLLARREAPTEQAPAVETIALPNVVGKNVADAKVDLTTSGVVADDVLVLLVASIKPEGEVIKQDPPAGTLVSKGTKVTVTLTVSNGPASPS